MMAVKQSGYTLKYVEEQTPEICMAAVKQNRHALEYVEDREAFEAYQFELSVNGIKDPDPGLIQ